MNARPRTLSLAAAADATTGGGKHLSHSAPGATSPCLWFSTAESNGRKLGAHTCWDVIESMATLAALSVFCCRHVEEVDDGYPCSVEADKCPVL